MKVEIHFYGGHVVKGEVDSLELIKFRNREVKGLYVHRSEEKDIIIPNQDILIIKEV
jgi:hypothetical protein